MAQLMRSAAPLKVEIRLQQALDGFIKDLSGDQKNEFLDDQDTFRKRLPDSNDVITFMGQLNAKASRSNFGPRAQSILQVTQQFAAIGDILIGGSQNLIACGVWTVVRFTLQAAVSSKKMIDKISEIFMKAGRSAPRYDALARLYDRKAAKLRTYYYEYFLTIVNMCHYLFKFLDKNVVSRTVSSLSDTECNAFESQLSEWSAQIKDETIFLMAQGIEEQLSLLESFRGLSKLDEARRLAKVRAQILDACSKYPYETSWKRFRKKGNTRLFDKIVAYASWKSGMANGDPSSTLVLTGSLGSGKSVLAANMIEDLGSAARIDKTPLLYFFCEYEYSPSINARAILGSLARQLLQSVTFTPPEDILKHDYLFEDLENIVDLIEDLVPRQQKVYCVIDGIYECDERSLADLCDALATLQGILKLHLCLNFRHEATTKSTIKGLGLQDVTIVDIPDNSDDIENFIRDELERCIENDLLKLGDPALVEEILTTLTNKAKGMFLWAALQTSALCWTSSDSEIRKALHSLPNSLAATFRRLLERAASHGLAGHENQRKILSHMVAAARPLTKDEMGDMLGITPFDLIWRPDQVCTNVDNILATCGSLIAVDEETFAVHFVHSSARKFLLERKDQDALSYDKSNTELAKLTVTYLNYYIFETEITRAKDANRNLFEAESAPAKVIQSSMPSGAVKDLSLRLLRAKKHKSSSSIIGSALSKGPVIDFDHIINGNRDNGSRQADANRIVHPFYGYAIDFWAHHAAENISFDEQYSKLLRKTIPRHLDKDKHAPEMNQIMTWANREAPEVLALVLHLLTDMKTGEVTYMVQEWIKSRLNFAAVYFGRGFKFNNNLEHLSFRAALLGQHGALDFFLYRACRLDSLTPNLLARCAMIAIYKDKYDIAKHIVWGDYRYIFEYIDPSSAAATFPTPLSENEPLLQRIGVWAAVFASEKCYQGVKSWTADPLKWLVDIRSQLTDRRDAFKRIALFFKLKMRLDGDRLRFNFTEDEEVEQLTEAMNELLMRSLTTLESDLVDNR